MSVVTPTYLARRCGASSASHVLTGVTIPAGKLAIVRGALNSDTITASVTDSAGNTWSVVRFTSAAIGGSTECFIAYSVLTSPLSSGTVTVTLSAAAGLVTDIGYFDSDTGWLSQASVLDKTSGGTFNLVTPWSSGPTATTTQADELLVGAAACGNFNGSASTPTAPWTEEADAICSSAANTRLVSQWRKVTATGAYAAQGTWAATEFGCAGIATFKTAASTAYTRTPADVLGLTDAATPVRTPGGPFSPSSLSGLAVWLDASQLGLADGVDVTAWPNLGSGGAPNLVGVAPNDLYPTMRASGSLYGKPVVRFTHDQRRLRMTGTGVDKDFTLVYVARIWGAVNGRVLTGIYTPNNILFGWWTSYQDVHYDAGFGVPNTQAPFTNDWKMYSADGISGVNSRFFSDGTLLSTATTAAGFGGTLGLSGYDAASTAETCDCEVAEVVVYNRTLSTVERQQVESYLRNKWMLPPQTFPRQIKVAL